MREYLKTLRKEKGLSQTKTAIKLEIGQTYYGYIEAGTRQADMSYSMMVKLAAAFEVSVQTIIDAEAEYIKQRRESA